MKLSIPYFTTHQEVEIDPGCLRAVLEPQPAAGQAADETELVRRALEHPIGSQRLCELSRGKGRILVITSDHTRPLPSRITLPPLLEEIRRGNPQARIKILIATGCHRATTREEMEQKFSRELVEREEFINHDCTDASRMAYKGIMPSGGELWINSLVDWADLVVAEGFIEPHFFAGFSGGRKSILPGIAGQKTVYANHCSKFIASERARAGILEGNPIHRDMLFAAQQAKLGFILNVIINAKKQVIAAFAGDCEQAHRQGCELSARLAGVDAVKAPIVITSNGGYPLDQNIYQSVKSMSAAEACVEQDGVIIVCSSCIDGHGGEAFYRWFTGEATPQQILEEIAAIPQQETRADQWQVQVMARVLCRASVIMVSAPSAERLITDMKMGYAPTLERALEMARAIKGQDAGITVIPDGVSVVVRS